MATVNKDFKIKNGLIVEGSSATVNGNQVLTENASDSYILDLIGGETLIKSVDSADFTVSAGGELFVATGSDLARDIDITTAIDNLDTDDIEEGTSNKYFTNNRVIDVLTGSTQSNISITNVGGELHVTAENGVDDSTTDDLEEGTSNKYFTDVRARQAISEGTGINYDNTTGVVSADLGDFDTDDLGEGASNKYFTTARVDSHLSGGDGVNYSAGTISADVAGGLHIDNAQIKIDRNTVDTWYDANGAAAGVQGNLDDVASDLNDHTTATSGVHGVTGDVVGTSDAQTLTNKTMGDDLLMNGFQISGLGTPDQSDHAATKAYVDSVTQGLHIHESAVAATTANIDITNDLQAGDIIDSVTLAATNRVLVKNQNNAAENGIYVVQASGAAERAADFDAPSEVDGGDFIFVTGGFYNDNTGWVQTSTGITTIGTDPISFTQFSGAGTFLAGNGLTLDGNTFEIDETITATRSYVVGETSAHSDLTTGVHGVTGDVVGTSDSQTLTNKTIDGGFLSGNTISNIANSSLVNDSITINGSATALGGSVTLDTDDVSEGTAQYFTQTRARQSLSGGTAINYDDTTGVISVDATELDTDDINEGTTNKYYTDSRVKSVLTGSTQSNISITEVAGELIITAENGVADSTTDDLDEGVTNHYFTESRAKIAAADLLVNHSTKTNITITGDETGLTITAENGVADSTTDDLDEGTTNLYFTDQRAIGAIQDTVPHFTAVEINSLAKQVASTISVPNASQITAYEFIATEYRSAKFLIKTAYGSHTELTEVLLTLDQSENIAITEYATVGTNGSSMTVTADYVSVGDTVRLRVTTLNNTSVVTVVGTLLA